MMHFSNASASGNACPVTFNFDPNTFKVGDMVSYRVPERFGDMPFAGILVAVEADHVLISADDNSGRPMRGTRASRPEVSASEALG